jgi:hypothetical protein
LDLVLLEELWHEEVFLVAVGMARKSILECLHHCPVEEEKNCVT